MWDGEIDRTEIEERSVHFGNLNEMRTLLVLLLALTPVHPFLPVTPPPLRLPTILHAADSSGKIDLRR